MYLSSIVYCVSFVLVSPQMSPYHSHFNPIKFNLAQIKNHVAEGVAGCV